MRQVAVEAVLLREGMPERWAGAERPGGLLARAGSGECWAGRLACASSPNNGMKLTPTVGPKSRVERGGGMARMIESSLGRSLSRGR